MLIENVAGKRCTLLQGLTLRAGAMRPLEKVADKALQLGEVALLNYRSHSSSQCRNAARLHYAVRPCYLFSIYICLCGGNPQPEAIGHSPACLQPESGASRICTVCNCPKILS